MSTVPAPVSDMLVTVKAREVQRGMLAEMGGEQSHAARHFMAAAHLELVLEKDYAQAGQEEMAFRSGLSAASCFWRAGQIEKAGLLFDALVDEYPGRANAVLDVMAELKRDYPRSASTNK